MHAHRPHHLATYPHQLFSRGAGLVSPQVSLLPRLACVAQQARVALWAVRVLPSLAADGAFAQVLGMAAGSAIRVRVSRSRVLLLCLCAGSVPLGPSECRCTQAFKCAEVCVLPDENGALESSLGDVRVPLRYCVPEKRACGLVNELAVMHVEDDCF